jgi:hypothetical protein
MREALQSQIVSEFRSARGNRIESRADAGYPHAPQEALLLKMGCRAVAAGRRYALILS